jgi:hypothetical protein
MAEEGRENVGGMIGTNEKSIVEDYGFFKHLHTVVLTTA